MSAFIKTISAQLILIAAAAQCEHAQYWVWLQQEDKAHAPLWYEVPLPSSPFQLISKPFALFTGFFKYLVHNVKDVELLMMHNRWNSRTHCLYFVVYLVG